MNLLVLDNKHNTGPVQNTTSALKVENNTNVDHILEQIKNFEKKYGLTYNLQVITNIERKTVKYEMLLRNNHWVTLPETLAKIRNDWKNNKLIYYLMYKAFKNYNKYNNSLSININISDINDKLLDTANAFLCYFENIPSNFLTFEILEDEEIPKKKKERKKFFNILRELKKRWFNIALDDIGWRNEKWELLFSNKERIDDFIEEWVLDIIKLDMELSRELYLYSIWREINLDKVREIYKIKNKVGNKIEDKDIIKYIWDYHKKIKEGNNITIIAEWIEGTFCRWNNWAKEAYESDIKTKDFMNFLYHKLWVTQFQWYALWKPSWELIVN